MHYQHAYHAGNFADVFKHVLLIGLLKALSAKDKPWFYLDTHAGAGRYELRQDTTRPQEWQNGVGRLRHGPGAPPWVSEYLEALQALRQDQETAYPGSPWWASHLAREQDRVVCCEQVDAIATQLSRAVPRAQVHRRNGYESQSLLPPREKRGLILVDPPFEARDEFDRITRFCEQSLARWRNAVIAVWYPLKQHYGPDRFLRRLVERSAVPWVDCRLDTGQASRGQMHACGLVVANAPYAWHQQAPDALQYLERALSLGPKSSAGLESLSSAGPKPERK